MLKVVIKWALIAKAMPKLAVSGFIHRVSIFKMTAPTAVSRARVQPGKDKLAVFPCVSGD